MHFQDEGNTPAFADDTEMSAMTQGKFRKIRMVDLGAVAGS